MKFKKMLSFALAAIIISGFTAGPVSNSSAPSLAIEASAAASSKLKAPAGITQSSAKNSITLQWKAVSGADGYRVYVYKPDKKQYIKYKTVSGTKCTVSKLISGKKYYFKIAAVVKENEKYTEQTVSESFGVTTKKLEAPKNINASSDYSSVTLKWNSVSGADAYRVYRYSTSKKKYVASKTTTSASCTIKGLSSGKAYKFKVAALVKNGDSYVVQSLSREISKSTAVELKTSDFTVYDSRGNKVNLSDFAGKPIVVNLWATWCGYCTQELPYFNEAYKKYGDDVVFLMVNLTGERGETEERVKNFLQKNNYTFPVYYDRDESAFHTLHSLPATIFIDKDGNLVEEHGGAITEKEFYEFLNKII